MKRIQVTVLCVLGMLAIASTAFAQEKGHFGIVAGFPTKVGVIWHATDMIAVRPDFTFNHGSSTTTVGAAQTKNTSATVGFNVAAPIYGKATENFHPYIAPAFTFSRTTTSTTVAGVTTAGTPVRNLGVQGTVGGQYSMARLFSVFAEVGIGYTHQTITAPTFSSTSNNWGVVSAVGGILYLNAKK